MKENIIHESFSLFQTKTDFNPRQAATYFSHPCLLETPLFQRNTSAFADFGEVTVSATRSHSKDTRSGSAAPGTHLKLDLCGTRVQVDP